MLSGIVRVSQISYIGAGLGHTNRHFGNHREWLSIAQLLDYFQTVRSGTYTWFNVSDLEHFFGFFGIVGEFGKVEAGVNLG